MGDGTKIEVVDSEGTVTVIGSGELNLRIAPELDRTLKTAIATGKEIVLDFRPALFIDSAIVQNVIDAAKALAKKDKKLTVLVLPKAHPQYVLNITGIDTLVTVVQDDSAG